jgi:hypothetical protein
MASAVREPTVGYHSSGTGVLTATRDPVVPSGRAIAQRIKATLGITG